MDCNNYGVKKGGKDYCKILNYDKEGFVIVEKPRIKNRNHDCKDYDNINDEEEE
jgi:hypothetical protein